MISFQPLHEDYRSCFEDMLVSVAAYWGKGHELMYAESWNFEYESWNLEHPEIFGKRVGEGENKARLYMEKLYGIRLQHEKSIITSKQVLEVIRSQLADEKPVMIYLNEYYCPTSPYYQIGYHINPYLIIGTEDQRDSFLCFIPTQAEKIQAISLDVIMKAYQHCVTLHNMEPPKKIASIEALYKKSAEKLLTKTNRKNRFDDMRAFAKDLETTLDISFEGIVDEKGINQSQLLNTFKYLTRRRKQYEVFLDYLGNNYDSKLLEVAEKFEIVSNKWNIVTNNLLKMFISGNRFKNITSISDKIKNIADCEELLAVSIIRKVGLRNE